MMFLLTCDKKLTKSQLSPTHASTERKITDELNHNAGWYEVREGSPVEVQWYFLVIKNWLIASLVLHTRELKEDYGKTKTKR